MIQSLHAAWCATSGQELHPVATERIFFELTKLGFTAEDVTAAVDYLQAFNRRGGGAKFRINVIKICGDPEVFASIVAEARATARNRRPAPTEKQKVEAMRERPADPEQTSTLTQGPAKHITEVFDAMRKAAK